MSENNKDVWAVIELMGRVTIAGRLTKPEDYGGLWKIDIPENDTYRTEFIGTQAIYRVRIVSEEIARAYALPGHAVIEYNAPIITRAEHQNAMENARAEYSRLSFENQTLRHRLTAINQLPANTEDE